MTKKERIKNTLEGKEVDKVAFSMWTHLPNIDLNYSRLAEETYNFFKKYDIDFIKTMNNGMYSVEDYGCIIDFSDIEKGGVAKIVSSPIESYEDWIKIKILPTDKGTLARELASLKILKEKIENNNDEVPLVFTVFSPLTTAAKLSRNKIFKHIENNKENLNLIYEALENITRTTVLLIEKAIEIGIDGIFFASQLSDYEKIEENIYKKFGEKYDLEVLKAAENLWFNIIHAHGNDIMFDILKDYPTQAFNWHAWESLPQVSYIANTSNKTILAGLVRSDITNKNKNKISDEIYKTLISTRGKKIIISPGCVIRYPLDENMLNFICKEKERIENFLRIKKII